MTKKIFDIVILTENRYIDPDIKNWYINQVLLEDKILQEKLENIGIKVCRKDWAISTGNTKNISRVSQAIRG